MTAFQIQRRFALAIADKERLRDRVGELDQRVGRGDQIPTFFWRSDDEIIRSLLKDGIRLDRIGLLERELRKVRREMTINEDRYFSPRSIVNPISTILASRRSRILTV